MHAIAYDNPMDRMDYGKEKGWIFMILNVAICDDDIESVTTMSNYLKKSDADTLYAKKSHKHSYTTKSDVESIVKKLVKSSALK